MIDGVERAQVEHAELIELLSKMVRDPNAGVQALAEFGVEFVSRHSPLAGYDPLVLTFEQRQYIKVAPNYCAHGHTGIVGWTAQPYPCADLKLFRGLLDKLTELGLQQELDAQAAQNLREDTERLKDARHSATPRPPADVELAPDDKPWLACRVATYFRPHTDASPVRVVCVRTPHEVGSHTALVSTRTGPAWYSWPISRWERPEPDPQPAQVKPERATFTWTGEWAPAMAWLDSLAESGVYRVPIGGRPPLAVIRKQVNGQGKPGDYLHVCTHNRGCRLLAHGQAVTWDGQGFTVTGGTPHDTHQHTSA